MRGVGFRFAAPEEPVSLRSRLLLALAYVLLLAIVALGVPLALSLRDRVDAEVRSQARAQADVVAATAAGLLDRAEDAATRRHDGRRAVRGRVVVVDRDGALLADSAGADRLGADYGDRPEIAAALRRRRRPGPAPQRHARPGDPRHRGAGARRRRPRRRGADDPERRRGRSRAMRRATLGLIAVGGIVLLLGLAVGVVIARQIAGPLRAARRRRARGSRRAT